MTINSIRALVDSEIEGRSFFATWRKTATQTTGAGIWFDLSMSPGNPVPNYYAASPNVSIALSQSVDGGIAHGGEVSHLGYKKHLKTFMAMTQTATAVPLPMILCDYLLFYPFVDMSITDEQPMTNTVPLQRSGFWFHYAARFCFYCAASARAGIFACNPRPFSVPLFNLPPSGPRASF